MEMFFYFRFEVDDLTTIDLRMFLTNNVNESKHGLTCKRRRTTWRMTDNEK